MVLKMVEDHEDRERYGERFFLMYAPIQSALQFLIISPYIILPYSYFSLPFFCPVLCPLPNCPWAI